MKNSNIQDTDSDERTLDELSGQNPATSMPLRLHSEPKRNIGLYSSESPISQLAVGLRTTAIANGSLSPPIPRLYDEATVASLQEKQPPDRLEFSREFRSSHLLKVLSEFSELLLSRVDNMDSLAGVEHILKIYPFESMEDDALSLIRVELQVPGLQGDPHRDIWKEYCRIFGETMTDYLKSVEPTTKQGRDFRSIMDDLSEGVGTF